MLEGGQQLHEGAADEAGEDAGECGDQPKAEGPGGLPG